MKDKWRKLSDSINKDTVPLKSDDFETVGTDYLQCQALLYKHSSTNYAALNAYLSRCTKEWLERFLDCDVLNVMFNILKEMGSKKFAKFTDTVLELQIITVIKSILNNTAGIEYLLNQEDVVLNLTFGKYVFLVFFSHFSPIVALGNT